MRQFQEPAITSCLQDRVSPSWTYTGYPDQFALLCLVDLNGFFGQVHPCPCHFGVFMEGEVGFLCELEILQFKSIVPQEE